MDRLTHSKILENYHFDPAHTLVPDAGVRHYGHGVTEPIYDSSHVEKWANLIANGLISID